MIKKIRPMTLAMLISLPFALAGLFLMISGHNRILAVEAASEQMEFIKNLPHVINAGDSQKMPLFCANSMLFLSPSLSGKISCAYHDLAPSVRNIVITVKDGPFVSCRLECLVDTRSRN